MEIQSYKKIKSNLYEITFKNNQKIKLYDDIILKYELLLKKEIDTKTLDKIILDNSYLESYFGALKYLSTKLRTEKEIRNKLKNYSKEAVNYTIERLKKEKYLNDEVYIKAYINDAINLKLMGPNKILYELKKLGFKENAILNYLNTLEDNIWYSKIDNYIKKRINSNHNLSTYMLKQKIRQDLNNKGFNNEDIAKVIEEYSFPNDNNIYEKEYIKLKNKYEKKYTGYDLENKINQVLYQKGFRK